MVRGRDQTANIVKVPNLKLKDHAYTSEFRNRDSRLYGCILFPYKGWHETDFSGPFYFRWNSDFYNDGNEPITGYSWRKIVALKSSFQPYAGEGWDAEDFPTIRYAELLLNYAEAHIENTAWDQKVRTALNDLRDRYGMPEFPSTMVSKQAALDFIKNGRRIELAGEGNRFFDKRRYGSEYSSKQMQGVTSAPNGEPLVEKSWSNHLPLMPIPQSAMYLNSLLKGDQNPGYGN